MSDHRPEATERPLIAVLDYGIGNLRSAEKALEHVGADARLTADRGLVAEAAGVVLPGVGAFGACMAALDATGLDTIAIGAARSGRPFLGICVGLQLLCAESEESPDVEGLGIFDVAVARIAGDVKLPQMQWNQLQVRSPHPLFDGLDPQPWMYFVHSYAAADSPMTIATCDYGGPVGAAMSSGSVTAVQFHPEKSSSAGLRLLANFVDSCR
ncbi:MAG: imidazole glycerol phosphate synthase subunit HisH [Microthrixaceae bacterium]|nr:imidazole glycerol phosphate synthase subunit HisH [Microthrixaceae bacterium]